MPTTSNDEWMYGMTNFQRSFVAHLESQIVSFRNLRDSLEARERHWRERCKALVAERNALQQRVMELEKELAVDTMAVIAAMRKGEQNGK